MDDMTIRIHRDAICMGDDIDEHSLTIVFKQYDNMDILKLLKVIDIWLIELNNVVWEVSMDQIILGYIEITNDIHEYNVCFHKPITTIDVTKKVWCSHKYKKVD